MLTRVAAWVPIWRADTRSAALLLTHIRGVFAHRTEVVAGAGEVLAEAGVADRCEVVPTDFFHSLVSGGDVHVLAQILHDCSDEMGGDPAEVC